MYTNTYSAAAVLTSYLNTNVSASFKIEHLTINNKHDHILILKNKKIFFPLNVWIVKSKMSKKKPRTMYKTYNEQYLHINIYIYIILLHDTNINYIE